MKAFWTVVILGVGGYAVYKHNHSSGCKGGLPCTTAPTQGAGPAGPSCALGKLQVMRATPVVSPMGGRLVRPTCYTGIPKLDPIDRGLVPAGGQPNQCVGWRPVRGGYVSPTGPKANCNGGKTPSDILYG